MDGSDRRGSSGSEATVLIWVAGLVAGVVWLWRHVTARVKSPRLVRTPTAHVAARVQVDVGHLALLLGLALGAVVALALASALVIRLMRRRMRARSVRVDEIILGPNDTAEPYEIMSALDAIHGQMLTRYVRSGVGQDFFTFEIVRTQDHMIHFLLSAPSYQQDWLRVLEDTFRSKYTNIRFRPWTDEFVRWPVTQQIVLSKHWRHATETVKDYQNSVVETVVQSLDRADGAAHLQFHLTPLPSEQLHTRLRNEIRGMEHSAKAVQQVDPAAPGVGYAESQAVKDSLQLYGKKAFRVEIRLGAENWETVQRVYGALCEADGENTFRATTVWAFRSAWVEWFYSRLPSLIAFRPSIMFSFPLATIIHLPTNRLRVNTLVRYYVRRAPAPRSIPRVAEDARAMVLDQESDDRLVVPEGDREAGVLLVGAQGSGKTTDELSLFRSDVYYRDAQGQPKCVVLIDIGKDTSKRALGMVPPDRSVVYFAPGMPDCPWTINPLQASINDDVMQENVLNAMQEVFGDQAIQFRSREFLGNAIGAVKEVLGPDADFTKVYEILTDGEFRNRVIQHVRDDHLKDYWQRTFIQAMQGNQRFLEEGLAAPRNKLDELLRNRLVRQALEAGNGRRQLDFRKIIKDRDVLIVNLDKSRLGDAGVRLLGIFVVTLLWYAMQAQNEIEERERVRVSLILDEAQNYLSEGFLNMLAEGRAYGLQVTLAIRFLAEIESERVVAGLRQLIQNVIVHQFQLLDEAKDFMQRFMRTWANAVQVNAESQDAINLGVDDIIRLPKFTSICQWMVNGAIQPAFYAKTINWERFYREDWRQAHLETQTLLARRGDAEEEVMTVADEEVELIIDLAPEQLAAPNTQAGALEIDAPKPSAELPAGVGSTKRSAEVGPDLASLVLGEDVVQRLLDQGRDELTGLFNRRVWERAVETAPDGQNAVAFIDLNDLTGVNNHGGHAAGDRLIRRAGEAIGRVTRQRDIAARIGGDEFAILARGMPEEGLDSWLERIRRELDESLVPASVGVALQKPGELLADTVGRADAEMYRVKPTKKGRRPDVAMLSDAPSASGDAPRAAALAASPIADSTAKASTGQKTSTGPDSWREHDPRKMFCLRFAMTPARLVQAAAQVGASDEDLIGACQWALNTNNMLANQALTRVRRVAGLKREDRILRPLATKLHKGVNELRQELVARKVDVSDAADTYQEHPEVASVDELVALMAEPVKAAR